MHVSSGEHHEVRGHRDGGICAHLVQREHVDAAQLEHQWHSGQLGRRGPLEHGIRVAPSLIHYDSEPVDRLL